jgi:hypothetical protein
MNQRSKILTASPAGSDKLPHDQVTNNPLTEFRSTKDTSFYSGVKPLSSQSTTLIQRSGTQLGHRKQAKQEILELSIIKRQLIDEIATLKGSYSQPTEREEMPSDSRLQARDFEDFTKDELMTMLAKAREEIIYLRSKNNRQKNKYEDLTKKMN